MERQIFNGTTSVGKPIPLPTTRPIYAPGVPTVTVAVSIDVAFYTAPDGTESPDVCSVIDPMSTSSRNVLTLNHQHYHTNSMVYRHVPSTPRLIISLD